MTVSCTPLIFPSLTLQTLLHVKNGSELKVNFCVKFIKQFHYFRFEIRNYHAHAIKRAYHKCKIITLIFLTYTFLNIFISYLVNYWNGSREERWNPTLNKTSTYKDFPYHLWFPFDTSISDGHYWIAFLYQPYAFHFLVSEFFCKLSLAREVETNNS